MLLKQHPQSWLQYRREIQSTSHLQYPECSFQRQHTCGYVPSCVKATKPLLPYVPSVHILFFFYLGRFIHAILQPVLSTPKSGSSLNDEMNSVAENNETRFVFQTFEEKVFCLCCRHFVYIFSIMCWQQNTCWFWGEAIKGRWDVWESTGQETQAGRQRPQVPPGEKQGRPGLPFCWSW